MEIPPSMRADLARWNNGAGIDLAGYVSCMGSFSLAVGYCTVFWPRLVLFEGYILRERGFSVRNVRQWEDGKRSRAAVEQVMNHEHLADLHMQDDDVAPDRLVALGTVLTEILEAKLRSQFPDHLCKVVFDKPEDADDLMGYQVSFWQVRNETLATPRHR